MKTFLVLTKNIREYKQSVNLLIFSKNVIFFFLKKHMPRTLVIFIFLKNECCTLFLDWHH